MREDKDSRCCTSLEEFNQIMKETEGKLSGNTHLELTGDGNGNVSAAAGRKRKRGGTANTRRRPGVTLAAANSHQPNLDLERIDSHCLVDKVVVVEQCRPAVRLVLIG